MAVRVLEGKIAEILNEDEVAINIGAANGVRENMVFAILSENMREIRDPDSGNVLGYLDKEKMRIVAKEVMERFTICSSLSGRVTRRLPRALEDDRVRQLE